MNVYEYNDYLIVLKDYLEKNSANRGIHAQLSKAAGMHPSYLSRILHGSIHLTPDQAAGLCSFWDLNRDETNYFLNLVHLSRAGTAKLRELLNIELKAMKRKYEDLGTHLPAEKMDIQKETLYYSAWYYCAVHVLLTIPSMQMEAAISEKLNLSLVQVRTILETLESLDLVKKNKNKWEPIKNNIHLDNNSWMAAIHHNNWRMKITDRIQFRNSEDLHYTGLHTLSRSDFKKIKAQLLDALVKVDKTVRPSKEEELCCLLMDWYMF